jgi:glycosidase
LQRIAAALQFALPGIPSVYYGDEVGMTGMLDPFNRQTYREEDADILDYYKTLGRLRNDEAVMGTGKALFYSTNGNVVGVLRYNLGGRDAFGNEVENRVILTVVNPSVRSHKIVIDLHQEKECMDSESLALFRDTAWKRADSLLTDSSIGIKGGLLEIALPPYTTEIFGLVW